MTSGIGVVVKWCRKIYNKLESNGESTGESGAVKAPVFGKFQSVNTTTSTDLSFTGKGELYLYAYSLSISNLKVDGVSCANAKPFRSSRDTNTSFDTFRIPFNQSVSLTVQDIYDADDVNYYVKYE